ncbi:MAG: DsbA family protein [Thermoflexales bacterium]|nr:DsbA family protein [Thermoflexales bacterium]MCS7324836.1 DsbA family protein [Thermoflexales bacterium]MCX7939832.1 DsbA family protein [Thermoflexales bacterium]MDW8054929.1 thioredoxin domain-containing protein [Anaerolineae bacterium]MDW8396395.1 thioredoxin domain-containing protein [Anaerolineae bacterium]
MSKRKELEARRRAEERKRMLQIAVTIIVIVLVVVGGALVLSTVSGGQQPGLPPVRAATYTETPPNAEPRALAWGPADAPIRVEEFIDYQCPACGLQARNFEPGIIAAFAASGKVRYEVKFLPFLEDRVGGRESRDAAQAVLCAAEQDRGWQMHYTIFANQPPSGAENVGNYSKARLKEMAATISGLDTNAFAACLDSNRYEQQVLQQRREAEQRGVDSTPTFIINGQRFPGARSADDLRQIFAQVAPQVVIP